MNYTGALKFLNKFSNYEKEANLLKPRFNLAPVKYILRRIEDPHKKLNIIHIAGTVGKGSVAHMLTSALTEQGYRTGLYTSPHLNDIRERIKIDNRFISKKSFAESISKISMAIKNDLDRFSYFEILTAAAFDAFSNSDVDIAIIEAGLGGRLDSTNVVDPLISVITKIGWDHMHVLGNSIKEISREKAGIIKKGRDVVISPQHYIARREILNICKTRHSKYYFSRPDKIVSQHSGESDYYSFYYGNNFSSNIKVSWKGDFQKENFATAIKTLEVLSDKNINVSIKSLEESVKQFSLNGRFEKIQLNNKLSVILDGAHNETAAKILSKELLTYYPDEKKIIILGMMKDKDHSNFFSMIKNISDTVILCNLNYERAIDSNDIYNTSKKYFGYSYCTKNLKEGLSLANKLIYNKGLILITGSLYTVSEARILLNCI